VAGFLAVISVALKPWSESTWIVMKHIYLGSNRNQYLDGEVGRGLPGEDEIGVLFRSRCLRVEHASLDTLCSKRSIM
jgi:hypothetical protein